MISVVQRVTEASVRVDQRIVGNIEHGLLVLVAVASRDTLVDAEYTAERLSHIRIFGDDAGRMNLSVEDVGGGVLVVSQFTLVADTRRGRRPSFSGAAAPDAAEALFEQLVGLLRRGPLQVETGQFAARMRIASINDGPVTMIIDSHDKFGDPEGRPAPRERREGRP